MANRPVSRKKNITGSGSVDRRGSGISGGGSSGGGTRGNFGGGGSGSLVKLIIIIAIVLLSGGGGLGALLGGNGSSSSNSTMDTVNTIGTVASMFLSDGYTSTAESGNSGWSSQPNTGVLNERVDSSARAKYTKVSGWGKSTYTIMVYMCGTDLESRSGMASKDIQEMLDANVSNNINLLIYTGGCTNWKKSGISSSTNQIYQVKKGKLTLVKDDIGDLSMTDPNTLSSFIKWSGNNYPADRYALILWDHGGGSVSGFGYDEKHKSAGSMNLAKINQALTDGGLKYDFVGFDACLMATVETGLVLNSHSDYMIASEETEPGIGWYYTDWLTELNKDTSMSTLEIGQNIIDDYISRCQSQCPGNKTTLSLVDLAELSATVPADLRNFAATTTEMIESQQYQAVSTARSSTREFNQSKIDQIDLIDFAIKMNCMEGDELAQSLKGAVKYNRTSSSINNAYGLSIYFPYRNTGKVDNMVHTYDAIGMDDSYSECIQKFASMAYYGQAVNGTSSSPSSMLYGTGNSTAVDSAEIVLELLDLFMTTNGRDNTEFLDRGVDINDAAEYIVDNNINPEDIQWTTNSAGDKVITLTENQWSNVQAVDVSMFVDDGEGYIDLGLDNAFEWDESGNLLAPTDRSWLAIDGQIVAYYHIDTTGDSDDYTITGRVPVYLNGERAELIIVFDSANENGYVAGACFDYHDGDVEVAAKNLTELQPGDTLDFICDYYSYDGTFNDSYYLGEQMTVTTDMSDMQISNLVIEDKDILVSFAFTDTYGNVLYTDGLKE